MRHPITKSITFALLACLLAACNLIAASEITPTPTINLPIVEFLYPPNDATIIEGAILDLDILAQDPHGVGVARVELFADDVKIHEQLPTDTSAATQFRVTMNWLAKGLGRHALSVVAYRPDGTQSAPQLLLINVLPPEPPAQPANPIQQPTLEPTPTQGF